MINVEERIFFLILLFFWSHSGKIRISYRNLTGMTCRYVTWDKHARMRTHFFSRGSSGHGNIATATGGGRCDKALSKQGIVERSDT